MSKAKKQFKSTVSDAKALELFRKYEEQTIKAFIRAANDEGYTTTKKFDQVGVWDEIMCSMSTDDICETLIESIQDSIGLEEYGFDGEDGGEDY